jgi:DNA-binding response OmpR family regulator
VTGTGSPIRVGIVDSDVEFLRALARRLDAIGWPHRVLGSAVPTDTLVATRLDAIAIDISVLGPQGWTYLDQVCARIPHLGVIVCTGQSTVAQRVRALRLGADDWLTKPCHPEELIARFEAVVRRRRRAGEDAAAPAVAAGEIELLPGQFMATAGGVPLDLTRREFELLDLLAGAEGQVLKREEVYERVWGYAMVHGDRSVDVYVRKLRQKLERASPGWTYIHTHFGIGYRFEAQGPESVAFEPVEEPVAVS